MDFTNSTFTPGVVNQNESDNTAHAGQSVQYQRLRDGLPQQPIDAPVMDGPAPFKNLKEEK